MQAIQNGSFVPPETCNCGCNLSTRRLGFALASGWSLKWRANCICTELLALALGGLIAQRFCGLVFDEPKRTVQVLTAIVSTEWKYSYEATATSEDEEDKMIRDTDDDVRWLDCTGNLFD